MTAPERLIAAMTAAALDPGLLEIILTIDATPVFAFEAPHDTSLELLATLERGGGLKAVVLGDDLERWRQTVDDEQRDAFLGRESMPAIMEAARVHYEELLRIDAELDTSPPTRRDYRGLLSDAVATARTWTRGELIAALADVPTIETRKPPIPAYDDEAIDADEPTIAGHWVALIPVAAPKGTVSS